jgi:hypothetical protein
MTTDKAERRLLAVLALLQGHLATHLQHQYHLCRSDLYKFQRRALAALRIPVADHCLASADQRQAGESVSG